MTETDYQRYRSRLHYGWTPEDALSVPVNTPRWMADIENEEGRPLVEFLRARQKKGQSWADIARSIGVKKDTLGHWVRKYKRQGLLGEYMPHRGYIPFTEVQRCRHLHEVEGLTFYAVSVATGYNPNTVADWLRYKTRVER